CGHYYYGDYFDLRYQRQGFVAWIDFRFGRSCYDPLFCYYRRCYGDNPRWERDMVALYAGRYSGEIVRPPATLVQQNTLIKNITVNKPVNVTNVKQVTVLAPLNQVDRQVVKLQEVPREQRLQAQKAAEGLHEAARQRRQVETQLLARGPAPVKLT